MRTFGETVTGYEIPVLNEREIRASAGILFLFAFIAILTAIMKHDMLLLKYFILGFFADFMVRIFISPRYAPTLILGRWIVSRQVPEYVGAAQKKFAWVIGLALGVIMLILINILNSYSVITGLICLICLVFLFFESAFGICLGCLFYRWFSKKSVRYCPGEVCGTNERHDIQRTTWIHFFIVLGFVAYLVISVFLFNDSFDRKPEDLWKIIASW